MKPPPLPFRIESEGAVLTVRLTPKAARDQIEGVAIFDDAPVLKARVRALPSEGEANKALVKLIAKWLRLPAARISLEAGSKSRLKRLKIEGEAEALTQRLEAALDKLTKA